MTVLDLTSFDQIRGVLAVSPSDLPDEILTPYSLEDDLEVDLDGWAEGWREVRATGEKRQQTLLKLYAKYRCAAWVAAAGQNFMFTRFTDGANQGQRSDAEGFEKLKRHMEARAASYREQLEEALSATYTATRATLFGRATPSRDPNIEGRS